MCHRHPTLALLVLLASVAAGRQAAAQVACGDTVGPGGSVTLAADVGPCDGSLGAIIVESATLDMAGHTLTCADQNLDGDVPDGVVLLGRKARVVNGTVAGCYSGVVLGGSGKHAVTGVTVAGTFADDAIYTIEGSNKNRVEGCTLAGAADDGFELSSDKNKILGNTIRASGEDGIDLTAGADKNKITGNTVTDSGDDGVDVGSSKNKITRNTVTGNAENGLDVRGRRNRVIGNTATGTVFGPDIIAGEPCSANIFRNNTFGTRAGDCIR